MKRQIGSLLIGIVVGLAIGLFLGWEQFPVEYTNSSISALSLRHKQEYTVMVAEGYQEDRDIDAALRRLQPLREENIYDYVQHLTEQFIAQSNVPAIPVMVALSEALGRLTPVMEIYRLTPVPTPTLFFGP